MVNKYNDAYRDYYNKIRKTKSNTKEINNIVSSRDDVYPSMANVKNHSYKRATYGAKKEKKRFRYIDRFILRLIVTFMLLLGVFILKIVPNEEAKEIYDKCKAAINTNIDYNEILSRIEKSGTNYTDILKNIEDKYSNIKEDIKLDDLNKALNL